MFLIWYILHCEKEKEKQAAELLRQRYCCLGKDEIFLITFEKMRRYNGNWHCQEETFLKGCVFAKIDSRKRLEKAAKETAVFRELGVGMYSLKLLKPERDFLEDMGGNTHCIAMSKGYIRDGETFVTEGPLCGRECKIRKIDRHKRMARIDSPLQIYQDQGLWTGLEIMAKS